jgi:hypothetical protein
MRLTSSMEGAERASVKKRGGSLILFLLEPLFFVLISSSVVLHLLVLRNPGINNSALGGGGGSIYLDSRSCEPYLHPCKGSPFVGLIQGFRHVAYRPREVTQMKVTDQNFGNAFHYSDQIIVSTCLLHKHMFS